MDTPPPASSPGPVAPVPPALQTAWPRSAQLTTAFLLGVAATLLVIHALGQLRWGSRPTELTYRVDLNHAGQTSQVENETTLNRDRSTVPGGPFAAWDNRDPRGNGVLDQRHHLVFGFWLGDSVGETPAGQGTKGLGKDAGVLAIEPAFAKVESGSGRRDNGSDGFLGFRR